MADSRKGTSSSVDAKEKKSSLDDEIGNEFLGSWKSLSMAGDDPMDFNFETVSNGKKKTFNFDKLDMDFNLDGDFDKLTSFKVDMPDLDFSSSSKKTTEPKITSKGDSSGSKQRKPDCFTFSFDFNELDSFNFDSTLIEEEKVSAKKLDNKDAIASMNSFTSHSTLTEGKKVSAKNIDNKDAVADRCEHQGSKVNLDGSDEAFDDFQTEGERISANNLDSKDAGAGSEHQGSDVNLVGGNEALDDCQIDKLPASNSATTSVVETIVDGAKTGDSLNEDFPSRSDSMEDLESSHGAQTSPQKQLSVSREETDEQIHTLEKANSTEQHAQDTTNILAVQSVDKNDVQATESDIQANSPASKVNKEYSGEQNVTNRKIAVIGSNDNNSQLKSPDPPQANGSVNNGVGCEKADSETPTGNPICTEPMLNDLDVEGTSSTNLLQANKHDLKANKDIQKSTSKLQIPLRSDSVVENVMPIKEKEPEVVSSKILLRPKETEPQLCRPSSTSVQVSSSLSRGIATFSAANEKRAASSVNDKATQRKAIGDLKSLPMEFRKGEPNSQGNAKSAKNLCNIRKSFNGYGIQNICKPITIPRNPDKEVTKEDSTVLGSRMNVKYTTNFGGSVNPTKSTDKSTMSNAQTSVNSTAVVSSMGSTWNLKMQSIEGLKTGKRMPDNVKFSRTMGGSKDQSNAAVKSEISSLTNLEKDAQGSTEPKIVYPVANAEKKTLQLTSLKRKTSEASIADQVHLHPQKRLSQSPSESRNLKEPPESTVEVQCCNQPVSTQTSLYDHPTSRLEGPNIKEHNISLTMENDGNVEKAEAYAKELEDICNMLKKRHEEAKELLVRAIVNNNSLLMLNHPMFDAKIRKVQKFAAQLISS